MKLTTDQELADAFGLSLKDFHEKRRRKGWPCVRIGRFNIRFTDEQIQQIVEMQTVAPDRGSATPVAVAGQTARSRARRRSA